MISLRMPRRGRAFPRRSALLSVLALAACTGDDFDPAQVPTITVTPVVAAPVVIFTWRPDGAQEIQVYRGTVADGTSANIVWSVVGTGTNSLASGIEYGRTPTAGATTLVTPKPLLPGQPYTVQINRVDPNDPRGSVSGAQYRYQSTQTFTLGALNLPP